MAVVVINFPWGKWFSGWDNLHPEFNYGLNLKRAIFGVWQENQGLGHVGGHGYAATLLHTIFVWLIDIFLPTKYVRAGFTMLMLLLGTLGTAVVTRRLLSPLTTRAELAGLLSGLFYMLHLGTVEQFYFQLEAFIIFYGLLPWVLWSLVGYLSTPSRKNLLIWIVVSVLFSAIGFIPPLFVVYGIILTFWLLNHLMNRRSWLTFRQALIVGLVALTCNAYWLLPVGYYTFFGSDVYLHSQNNQLSTQDFQLQSQAFGGIDDVALVRGFVFDALDSSSISTDPVFYAMQSWHDHLGNWWVLAAGMFLFGGVIAGLVVVVRARNPWAISLLLMFGFGVIALGQRIWGVEILSNMLHELPVVNQAFRASFTKVSVPVVFIYAVLFGMGIVGVVDALKIKNKIIISCWACISILVIMAYGWPIFRGEFLYDRLKTEIPNDYFELFEYLDTQPATDRIAIFPLTWQWGWEIHDWGYSGSGFLWYGIQQSLLHRSFDVWSRQNETYYHKITQALMSGDVENVANVLTQYRVDYILVDPTLVYPGFGIEATGQLALQDLLASWEQVRKVGDFGKLELYKITFENDVVWAPYSYQKNELMPDYLTKDLLWPNVGSYLEMKDGGVIYPFMDFLVARPIDDMRMAADEQLIWTKEISPGDYEMRFPAMEWGNLVTMVARVERKDNGAELKFSNNLPKILIDGMGVTPDSTSSAVLSNTLVDYIAVSDAVIDVDNNSELSFDAQFGEKLFIAGYGGEPVSTLDLMESYVSQQVQQCWTRPGYDGEIKADLQINRLALEATDASACLTHRLGKLAFDESQLIQLNFEYRGNNLSRPLVCLLQEEDTERYCYNGDTSNDYLSSDNWTTVKQLVPITRPGTYWLDVIGRSGDAAGERAEIEYRDIGVSVFEEMEKVDFPMSYWDELAREVRKDVKTPRGQLSLSAASYSFADWKPEIQMGQVKNCNVLEQGKVLSERLFGGMRYWSSDGGVSCESVFFPQLKTDVDMLVHVKGIHALGRGFKYYLRNLATGRQDIEYLFDQEDFDSFTPFPAGKVGNRGLSFDLENRSFTNLASENSLMNAEFISFPIDYLSRVALVPREYSRDISNGDLRVRNNLVVIDSLNLGDAFYSVQAIGSGLISLNQGYNEGWVAYDVGKFKNQNSRIKMLMPWWFGEKLEHVKVNGWANGWIIPAEETSDKLQVTNENGEIVSPAVQDRNDRQIVIVYWPQYLEWLGLLVLVMTLGGLGYWLVKEKN